MFSKFEPSEYASTIYYADMFRIREKVWMIMGYGKSRGGMIASEGNRADDIARDSVAIRCNGGTVQGRCDFGAISPEADPELSRFYDLSNIAYCLSPEQTQSFYGDSPKLIRQCDLGVIAEMSVTYPYPAAFAPHVFPLSALMEHSNDEMRVSRFKKVLNEAEGKPNLLLVPFMPSIEDKASLYKAFDE